MQRMDVSDAEDHGDDDDEDLDELLAEANLVQQVEDENEDGDADQDADAEADADVDVDAHGDSKGRSGSKTTSRGRNGSNGLKHKASRRTSMMTRPTFARKQRQHSYTDLVSPTTDEDPDLVPRFNIFDIPVFGVTMLGASHGFDAAGRTTGFVIWVNRRGIMVDPPPNSSAILEIMGIPPRSIECVILTHCHADHDAGTFQKILRTTQIHLFTTRTIKRSFLRKYSAITGYDETFLDSLFNFHPVVVGRPLYLYGGELTFFYSVHTIPCIGVSCAVGGESLVYSADTRFEPAFIDRLVSDGKAGAGRAKQLREFPFHHTVVLHELGVPPIHTPRAAIEELVKDPTRVDKHGVHLKQRLFLVHATRQTGKDLGLHQCRDWDTIRIRVSQDKRGKKAEIVSLLGHIAWFKPFASKMIATSKRLGDADLDPDQAGNADGPSSETADHSRSRLLRKLANKCKVRKFKAGETIVRLRADQVPDRLWVVVAGVARDAEREGDGVGFAGESAAAVAHNGNGNGTDDSARAPSPAKRRATARHPLAKTRMFYPVGECFGEAGLMKTLEAHCDRAHVEQLENQTALGKLHSLVANGKVERHIYDELKKLRSHGGSQHARRGKAMSVGNRFSLHMRDSSGATAAPDAPPSLFVEAHSSDVYVLELRNKDILSLLPKPARVEMYTLLRRFTGYPEDERWHALTLNPPLLELLQSQLCVREFLFIMDDQPTSFASGDVLQSGRGGGSSPSVFLVQTGALRVTPHKGVKSFRGLEEAHVDSVVMDMGRGGFIADVNSMLKNEASQHRITAVHDGAYFGIQRDRFLSFLNEFPVGFTSGCRGGRRDEIAC